MPPLIAFDIIQVVKYLSAMKLVHSTSVTKEQIIEFLEKDESRWLCISYYLNSRNLVERVNNKFTITLDGEKLLSYIDKNGGACKSLKQCGCKTYCL